MARVKRMYCIEPKLGVIRAWQGHKKETKWFYAAKGSFLVKTVDMSTLEKIEYHLQDSESNVLEISRGHYNGFEALEESSVLTVFSDFGLNESIADDFRLDIQAFDW
jgi:dTDP-4-dehydrorhamnose 3,5-epimerase-like enzyme